MNIAVIGAGNIGGTLGRKWAAAGHAVKMGVRDPDKSSGRGIRADFVHVDEAVAGATVIVFAIPGQAMPAMVAGVSQSLGGKILIDATNNVGAAVMNSVDLIADQAPDAQIYRAFNSLGWENLQDPYFGDERADLFFCGQGGSGRSVVAQLIEDIGLRPVYVGGIDQAAMLDGLTRLWFALAYGQKRGRHMAFKLLGH